MGRCESLVCVLVCGCLSVKALPTRCACVCMCVCRLKSLSVTCLCSSEVEVVGQPTDLTLAL